VVNQYDTLLRLDTAIQQRIGREKNSVGELTMGVSEPFEDEARPVAMKGGIAFDQVAQIIGHPTAQCVRSRSGVVPGW
jgi:hypothetical protein